MDYTVYTSVKNRFITYPNLCDLFKLLSIETWKRIEYAYLKPGVKVFETTITQNLIFSINAYNDQYGLDIDIYEARDEKRNGNDLELVIRYPADGIEYYAPIQAKKVYKNGIYGSMGKTGQIDSLMQYGRAQRAKPLYLLFNYDARARYSDVTFTNPLELTGCTLIDAKFLYDNYCYNYTESDGTTITCWEIPSFFDLHPDPAFPFHELVCHNNSKDLHTKLQEVGILEKAENAEQAIVLAGDASNGFFPINTFTPDDEWQHINEIDADIEQGLKQISVSAQPRILLSPDEYERYTKGASEQKEKVYPEFRPRNRIVLTKGKEKQ